ncbi:MAG TPA: SAM-dependent methyltransferase [Streptosporangiaceae bacterium]|jgi:hypothetical protein|nr:SAM-dependent methyltransferase [Streptosporangiaceae bacterium]
MGGMRNWVDWHLGYDDPASALSARLECIRAHLRRALDDAPAGPLRLVSLCAGQGRDVLAVLPRHERRDDVAALLVELDSRNAGLAWRTAAEAGLDQVQVREADAGLVANYADYLPADILLLCGIFGNVSDADIERTIKAAPALCAPGATVLWTRHRRAPDRTPSLRAWFAQAGFDEVAFDSLDTETLTGVGVNRLSRPVVPVALPANPLFTFGTG